MRRLKAEFELSSTEVCAPKCYDAFSRSGSLKPGRRIQHLLKADSGFLQVSCLTEQKRFKLRLFRLDALIISAHSLVVKQTRPLGGLESWRPTRVLDPGLGPTSSRVLNPPCPSGPAPALNIHQRWSRRPTASLWPSGTKGCLESWDVSNMSSRLFNSSNTLKCLKRGGG